MDYMTNLPELKPFQRSVSIVGVGVTPYMHTMDIPEMNGITEGEMFGYAAIEAMKDAHMDGSDIEFYIQGQAGPGWVSNFATPNMHVANWFGVKAKGSFHHSEACATGYIGIETAANLVASGTYDIVLTGGIDMQYSIAWPTRVLTKRRHATDAIFHEVVCSTVPRDYSQFQRSAAPLSLEAWLVHYKEEYGLSDEDLDETLLKMSYYARQMAAKNPHSLNHDTYDELAAQAGLKDGMEYLRSKYNPKMGNYVYASNCEVRCDGAGAAIICATDIARKFTDHPIEILGIGHSCLENGTPMLEKYATERAYKQVKDLTGLSGADMDLFMVNDFYQQSQILAADACEYLPKGEGWKYIRDGKCTNTGERPLQTNGGRCNYGHAAVASGIHDHYEAVKQMRGEMGETQITKPVNYAMLRGFGGGQNLTCTVLKKL